MDGHGYEFPHFTFGMQEVARGAANSYFGRALDIFGALNFGLLHITRSSAASKIMLECSNELVYLNWIIDNS